MVTYTGDPATGLLIFLLLIALAIGVIRMGVLSLTRETRRVADELAYISRILGDRDTAPEP